MVHKIVWSSILRIVNVFVSRIIRSVRSLCTISASGWQSFTSINMKFLLITTRVSWTLAVWDLTFFARPVNRPGYSKVLKWTNVGSHPRCVGYPYSPTISYSLTPQSSVGKYNARWRECLFVSSNATFSKLVSHLAGIQNCVWPIEKNVAWVLRSLTYFGLEIASGHKL